VTIDPFRIVAVDPLPQKLRELFLQQLPSPIYRFQCPEGGEADELLRLVRGANALVSRYRMVSAELIAEAGAELQLVQLMGRLPDRVDLETARQAGVPVAVMPHGGAVAVAEHTMALMLALSRKLLAGHRGVVAAEYRERGLEPEVSSEWRFAFNWLGFSDVVELRGKTLGLVGLGEIGREVARRATAFEMTVIYYQRHQIPEPLEKILGVRHVILDDLLQEADFVSLHAPHTAETECLMDTKRLALMKPTAFLVNTARGGLVDETALVTCLREGRLAGAGLDVFVKEPLPADHPLLTMENVILAPHTGGGSGGGHRLHIRQLLANIARVAEGGKPLYLVESESFSCQTSP
jgi:phosphoglycerate dehydrogenase-like enzyme